MVMNGTTGPAATFAGIEYRASSGCNWTITGAQNTCAAVGIATAWASGTGRNRCSQREQAGPSSTSDNVASTERMKL